MNSDITIIILTYNEELHIRRVIESAHKITSEVVIVDSFSTDRTVQIALDNNALVVQNPFVNQAQQFQWAMDQDLIKTSWTMRLDADEYVTPELVIEITTRLPLLDDEVSGIILKRQVHFMGHWIRHGGYYPIKLLRIWRTGHAAIEQRWMDEHTHLIQGRQIEFKYDFIDDNLNSLTWWTEKHNGYATREAIDIINRKYGLQQYAETTVATFSGNQSQVKRWYKNNLYLRLPLFFRAFLYFQFRYWLKLGFLDGWKGLIWHFLQAFWYRFLVDAKIAQIEWWAKTEKKSVQTILAEKFNYHL